MSIPLEVVEVRGNTDDRLARSQAVAAARVSHISDSVARTNMVRRGTSKPEQLGRGRDQVARRLQELIDSRGYSVSRLERDMDVGRGYVAEALRGGKKLTVELIVEILGVLNIKLEEIFAVRSSRDLDATQAESTSGLPAAMRDAPPLLQALVLTLAAKGLLSVDEIEQRQREVVVTVNERPPGQR